ncbi:type IV secretion protein Rhs, partial [Lysobacteraceae bacterium NML07-0707]
MNGQDLNGIWQADPDIRERLEKRLAADGTAQGWILTTADDVIEIYDEDGRLVELVSPESGHLWLNYTADTGLLDSVSDASGRKIVFSYNEKHQVAAITLPDKSQYRYQYGANGNLQIMDAPATGITRHQRHYMYEDARFPHALTAILLDGVQYAYWDYDSQGRAIRSGHGARSSGVDLFQFEYHDNGTTTITDSLGQRRNYRFHLQHGTVHLAGLDVACSFCSGNAQSITYDDYGFVDKEIDFSGAVVDHEHDVYGRQIRKVEAADNPLQKRTTLTAWHEKLHRPLLREVLDAKDVVVSRERWRYTQRGQLLDYIREDPGNGPQRRTHYRYCEADDVTTGKCPREGLLLEVDGARSDVSDITRYQYYSENHPGCDDGTDQCIYRKGDLWRITNAIGQVTEFLAYDGAGRPLSWRDANGLITRLGYHARGWLAERSEHDGDSVRRWRFGYTASGKLQQIIQPNGDALNFSYDSSQRLTGVRDSHGNQIKYTLDAAGNRIREEILDSVGQLTYAASRNYNSQGWLQQATDAYGHGQQYAYDPLGRLRRATDALGHIDSYQYDALSRPEKILGDVGRIGATTMVAYDTLDQVIRVIDPKGLETRYQYNALGDLINQYSPDTGGNVFTYDAIGNRVSTTDAAGITRRYHYDALNRLIRVEAPGGLLRYGYDHSFSGCPADARYGKGKLTRIYSQDNQAHYCYDRYGQVVAMQQAVGHSRLWQKYQYDISGKRTGVTFPDGAQVRYQRNLLGEISSIHYVAPDGSSQTVVEAVQYVPFGAARGWRYGNGRLLHRRLD